MICLLLPKKTSKTIDECMLLTLVGKCLSYSHCWVNIILKMQHFAGDFQRYQLLKLLILLYLCEMYFWDIWVILEKRWVSNFINNCGFQTLSTKWLPKCLNFNSNDIEQALPIRFCEVFSNMIFVITYHGWWNMVHPMRLNGSESFSFSTGGEIRLSNSTGNFHRTFE